MIKKPDGYYYCCSKPRPTGSAARGLRDPHEDPGQSASWRAWNGTGYNVQFINPYTNPQPPESHVCAPVPFPKIEKMVQSLTYNSFFRKYLLVGNSQWFDPNRGEWVYGFWYSTSSDLLNWSLRTLLLEIPLWNYQCGGEDQAAYPVVLNPASTDRNFGTTGQSTYLYFTRVSTTRTATSTADGPGPDPDQVPRADNRALRGDGARPLRALRKARPNRRRGRSSAGCGRPPRDGPRDR